MNAQSLLTVGPNGKAQRYSSIRAASRALSGDGTDSLRNTIARRAEEGGFVGDVWVQLSNIPSVNRPR